MRKSIALWKKISFVGCQAMLVGFGGTCLPDNLFADTAGGIVNGLIVAGVNLVLNGSGLQV